MSFDLQMLEQISLYLRGQIDVAELESRFAEITWDLDEEPPATRRVAFEALRLASETANGDWTDEVLREQLKRLLQTIPTSGTVSVAGEQFLERLSVAETGSPVIVRFSINLKAKAILDTRLKRNWQ
jgi:hypothetical protein